ncbi:hypothetical protein [Shewanella sp. SM96]|uniref:hypothetical protein n=1 Tax=Shewanella TaxID=22 RepID=UPI0021DA9CD3|nr:hypothetical protein [Shewanella sp. SM96]MCU8005264.1 hypothetical protein [Shewanella sp. SM96]
MPSFLLTYSVHPQDPSYQSDVDKAGKVRNDIAKIKKWDKLDDVETTFVGNMLVLGDTNHKRKLAELEVKSQFIPILKEHKSGSLDVIIHCALMVDGLGQAMTFDVVNK